MILVSFFCLIGMDECVMVISSGFYEGLLLVMMMIDDILVVMDVSVVND